MNLFFDDGLVPGTLIRREDCAGATGSAFLRRVFFVSDRIMLSQIREITGIDGTTLQNWTRRGWVGTPSARKYDSEQLARILILNMARGCMRLDRIVFLVSYVNGRIFDPSDSLIRDSDIYDCLCAMAGFDAGPGDSCPDALRRAAVAVTERYASSVPAVDDLEIARWQRLCQPCIGGGLLS